MASKRKGLGRGLDALLGTPSAPAQTDAQPGKSGALQEIPVDLLQRGQYQPRIDMRSDSLTELADSIRAQGLVQPIIVRPLAGGRRYEIIAGERRWRAARMAGLTTIAAVVRNVDDASAGAMGLIENIQRENLNPLEEAKALSRLLHEFDMTHQDAADAVGRSRAAVSNLLRLLDLDDAVKQMVESRELEMGHARALLGLSGNAQVGAAAEVVRKGLSVRETERLVKRLAAPAGKTTPAPVANPDVRRLETSLGERLGATVRIQQGKAGRGSLTISYNSLDELDGILAHIK